VAVASAGLYASLHLAPDNHASTPPLSFLQAGCPSCRPTNSVKALKAKVPFQVEGCKFTLELVTRFRHKSLGISNEKQS